MSCPSRRPEFGSRQPDWAAPVWLQQPSVTLAPGDLETCPPQAPAHMCTHIQTHTHTNRVMDIKLRF